MNKKRSFGLIEGKSYAGMMEIIDAVLKAADIELLRVKKIGRGLIFAAFTGELGAIVVGIDKARFLAAELKIKISVFLLPNPDLIVAQLLKDELKI